VVLAHELAHAYTQLGADIDGRRWAAPSFAKAETALKEGLDRALQLRRRRREQRETKEQRPDRAIAAGPPASIASQLPKAKRFCIYTRHSRLSLPCGFANATGPFSRTRKIRIGPRE
jgi:hypothetical protein